MPSATKTKQSEISQLMPQNVEAEEAVLGAILVNPRCLDKVISTLKPEYFYKPAHRYIYEAILQLTNRNEVIDIVSVSDTLNINQKLELVGGRAFINDLSLKCIHTANVKYYADMVEEKALKRSLINAGSEIITSGYDLCSSEESLEKAEKLDLDELTNGFQKSDLIILAARPAMGKTAFALNIAQNVALKYKKNVAIFSLEMSKEQLVQRLMCAEAEVESQRVKTGNMQAQDWEKLANAMNALSESSIWIDDTPGATLTDIRAKCRRLAMTQELNLIVIDYLQLMETGGRDLERTQQISQISRGLKLLAKELNVPVIALSQLSRATEQRTDKRPQLSDLRDSGSIEQDADIVMFIYRGEYYAQKGQVEGDEAEELAKSKGEAEVIIAKHRSGPTGTVELIFQKNITKFKNKIKTVTSDLPF